MSINTFVPRKLPRLPVKWENLIEPIGKAHEAIGRFDQTLVSLYRYNVFFSVLKTQEAVLSLEFQQKNGRRVTLEDVLIFDACGKTLPKKKKTMKDVINYRRALDKGAHGIARRPLSLKLIKTMHSLVKKNSHVSKDVGRFRDRQNWIGPIGCTKEEAYFYPPSPRLVKKAMANLENYILHKEIDPLAQLAIVFVQFLIIHPFMDGNGRITRLLIPLFLGHKKLISHPVFYMSRHFQKHRSSYLQKIFNTSLKNDWEGWIRFFLEGIITESESQLKKLKKMISLYNSLINILSELVDEKAAIKICNFLFTHPVFSKQQFTKYVRISSEKTKRILNKLKDKKMISEFEREHLTKFQPLIRIAKNNRSAD